METNIKNDRWNAEYYKNNSDNQYKTGMKTLLGIQFQGNENVLDIGCGDGRITAEIAQLVPRGFVLGIDISRNMITEAKKSFGVIRNIAFQCEDAAAFSSTKNFDVVVSNSTFHWIKNQKGALKNIYDHAKPGGHLNITMAAFQENPISHVHNSPKWAPILAHREETYFPQTIDSMQTMLESCGFKDIDVQCNVAKRLLKNKEELFNWAFAWVPHSTGLSDNKAREFTQDVVDSVCRTQKDGQVILEIVRLNARAIKPVI